ncbi:MAG: Arc family DNA-binding protein [Candidatus Kerfeldbacteria bacterium]|nr:Arc family DNA-binding protein [Candidatus Kerfeldbacteria bacterium]
MPENEQKSFLLRIDRRTFDALQRWAEDELRSLNGQIEWIVREGLRKQGRLPKDESRHK